MTYTKKVYYHDTDCGKVVYYANYLKYLEEARTEDLHQRGVILKEWEDKGIAFVVRNVQIAYKAPARYADTLEISTQIRQIKNASMLFYQEVRRGAELLVSAETTLVCVDTAAWTPVAIPQELRACIEK